MKDIKKEIKNENDVKHEGDKKTVIKMVPDIRMLSDMIEVIYDKEWLSRTGNIELYYMYRGIFLNDEDKAKIDGHMLRYDITIIPPFMLGCEFVKTAGHYHQFVPGTNVTYPEMYEVLDGNAHFLMQKSDGSAIKDVVMINAEKGDKVIVPPGYGHITINTSDNMLKIANWVAKDKDSLYDPIRFKKGGAYYCLVDRIVKNPLYGKIPDIRFLKPSNFNKIGLRKKDSSYQLVDDIDKLEFLTSPQDYEELFEEIFV